jgi:ubiquinone/menaquinone biosynthesis C-methylase UbiE
MDALKSAPGAEAAHTSSWHFKPKSYTGVDFSTRAIEFCRSYYKLNGLNFHHGNAEALSFPDNSFDVVVNVEASLYYPNITKFFEHVRRVLKQDGYFLYTTCATKKRLRSGTHSLRTWA